MNINAPHLHLLINHVPVFFYFFAAAALAYGWWRRRREFHVVGGALCILGALATQAALMTGERSEHVVEPLPGVSEAIIEEHEEAAESARIAAAAAAGLALVVLWLERRSRPAARPLGLVLLLASLLTFAILVRVALLGGQIRHTEIRADVAPSQPPVEDWIGA